jgi:4-amino-4-deoxy-L-arabinose transferase-like glycosyltransferase
MIRARLTFLAGAALVIVVFGLPLFHNLGRADLRGDEPIYAFAVDRMLENGDWLTPRSIPSDQAPFLEKPPLKFWIVAASMRARLIPHDEFGHRFWDAVFGSLAFLYVLALGYRAGGIVCGLTAVLVLFVHRPLILEHGLRSDNMEAALVLSYCGGMYHALRWSTAETRGGRWLHPIAVGLWFVLGFMTKFVAAIFLPGVLGAMALLFRQWRSKAIEDWRPWAISCVLVGALTVPWFAYEYKLEGGAFWDTIFGVHVLERFTSFLDPTHVHPWYFYWADLYASLESSQTLILVAAGLVLLLYEVIRYRSALAGLLLLWFALPVFTISVSTSKLYHYMYPFLPALAVGAGLVPVAILEVGGRYQNVIDRVVRRVLPASRGLRMPTPLRWLLIGLGAAALVIAIATPMFGSFTLRTAGGTILFRSGTIMRPMVVATIALVLVGMPSVVARALIIIAAVTTLPFTPYSRLTESLMLERHAPMRALRDCLLVAQRAGAPRGVYLHARDWGQWRYYYYLRDLGTSEDEANNDARFAPRMFDAAQQRPVLLGAVDYGRLRSELVRASGRAAGSALDAVRRVRFEDDGRLLLLPGMYGSCAHAADGEQ